jgi:hypothetical protein
MRKMEGDGGKGRRGARERERKGRKSDAHLALACAKLYLK